MRVVSNHNKLVCLSLNYAGDVEELSLIVRYPALIALKFMPMPLKCIT